MINEKEWPLVAVNDDGIRPAGKPDACFYCQQKVGHPHARDCVVVSKKVRLRYTIDVEVSVPHFWTKNEIEFHRNQSSWCAGNIITEIVEYEERVEESGDCMCGKVHCTFMEVSDNTPTRELRK